MRFKSFGREKNSPLIGIKGEAQGKYLVLSAAR